MHIPGTRGWIQAGLWARYRALEEMSAERPCDFPVYLDLVKGRQSFRAPRPELYKTLLNDKKTDVLAIKCLQHLFSHRPKHLISYFTTEKAWQTLRVYEPKYIGRTNTDREN